MTNEELASCPLAWDHACARGGLLIRRSVFVLAPSLPLSCDQALAGRAPPPPPCIAIVRPQLTSPKSCRMFIWHSDSVNSTKYGGGTRTGGASGAEGAVREGEKQRELRPDFPDGNGLLDCMIQVTDRRPQPAYLTPVRRSGSSNIYGEHFIP